MGLLPPTHLLHPGDVSGDAGEDGGFLGCVAAEGRPKANDAVDLPGFAIAAVQGPARVALQTEGSPAQGSGSSKPKGCFPPSPLRLGGWVCGCCLSF